MIATLRVRPLVIVLAVQLLLAGGLLVAIASGALDNVFGGGDSGGSGTTVRASRAASAPALSARPAVAAVPRARVNHFDATRAMAWARRQVALGPRPAGSPAQRQAADFLRAALPAGRFQPIGDGLRNIVGQLPGRGAPIVLVAHYDTTPVAGYLGANNSAAAVGAVLELARDLRHAPPGRPIRFLLTDGEEAGTYPVAPEAFYSSGLRGSRFAAAHPPRPAYVIVLDFVAQKGLRYTRDAGSDPALWAQLANAASHVGVGAVVSTQTTSEVLDDHTPFVRRGVSAIDLIDFNYPCWQKTCDTLDKLSTRSLDATGEAVYRLVRTLRQQ